MLPALALTNIDPDGPVTVSPAAPIIPVFAVNVLRMCR